MKSKLIIILSILFFVLSFVPTQAQENQLLVAPASKMVEYTNEQSEIKEQVTITNTYKNKISVKIEAVLLGLNNKDGKLFVIEDSESTKAILSNVNLDNTSLEIPAQSDAKVGFTIKNLQNFPESNAIGIRVSDITTPNSDNLSINSTIIATYIIEKTSGKIDLTINAQVKRASLFSNEVSITGDIQNIGSRIFNPLGSIEIWKNGKRIKTVEISSQVSRELLPGAKVDFTVDTEFPEMSNPLASTGSYEIKVIGKPTPYESLVESNNFYFYKIDIVLVFLAILILLTAIGILLYSRVYIKSKTSKKRK